MLTSIALISLGDEYLIQAKFLIDDEESESRKKQIDENLEHAIVEYFKALSIYSIKTIWFSLAKALLMKKDFLTAQEYLNNYLNHIQPEKYNDMVIKLFLQYHLRVLGYGSIQELDIEVNRLKVLGNSTSRA